MSRISRKYYAFLLVFVLSTLVLLFVPKIIVKAIDPSSSRLGYYKGNQYIADGEGRAVLAGGLVGVNSKATYIQFLQNKNADSSLNAGGYSQNRDGSAFIVCSMLGAWPAEKCRNPSSANPSLSYIDSSNVVTAAGWNRLISIINDSGTSFNNVRVYSAVNTIYSLTQKDFYYVGIANTKDAFVFSQVINGVTRTFRIFIDCANPLGGLGLDIDEPNWNIVPSITANSTTVSPGGTITWTYYVANRSVDSAITTLDNTTANVNYYLQYSTTGGGFINTNNVGPRIYPSGSAHNTESVRGTITTSVPAGTANNTRYCARTGADPSRMINGSLTTAPVYSAELCVIVSVDPPPPVSTVPMECRPIEFLVQPRTYPAVSHRAPNGTLYYTAPRTIPVRASTSRQSWGPYSSETTVNATANHTTGDAYTVTFNETTNHVSGYQDLYEIRGLEILDYSRILIGYEQGSEIFDYSWIVNGVNPRTGFPTYDTGPRSFSPPRYETVPVYDEGPRSYSPRRYHMLYSGTIPRYTSAASWTTSIGPCYNYALSANINSFGAKLEAGSSVSVVPSVRSTVYSGIGNSVPHTKSRNTTWYITRIIVPSNNVSQLSYISGSRNNVDPCNNFNPSNVGSCSVSSGTSVFSTSGVPTGSTGTSLTAPDSPAGTKICLAFSVRDEDGWDRSSTNSMYSHSSFDPANNCIVVVRKPKVQIWGGDLWSRGSVQTSRSVKDNTVYGSWGEYGIFATGAINNIASGSAFSNLAGIPASANVCSYSTLSFTNIPTGGTSCTGALGTIGNYSGTTRDIPDVSASFPVNETTPTISSSINLSSLTNSLSPGGNGLYRAVGNLNITGGNIQKGQWIVINAPGQTVTISGNINYTSESLLGIDEIPQVVIIGANINIDNSVTNIDAWLIARGDINTCSAIATNARLTINQCGNTLLVNGPIMANRLYLRRTAGSGLGLESNIPAEIFNTRPDAYLWAFSKANTDGRAQTVYTKELPPRF